MKKWFQNESRRLNVLLAVLIVIAIAIAVLINALAAKLSERYPLSADLTANAAYEVGQDTKEILQGLTQDVAIYVLADKGTFNGNPYLVQTRTLLERYPRLSEYISLEFIDYTRDPSFAAKYPEQDLSAGDVLVEGPEAVKKISLANLFTYTYDAQGAIQISGSRTEEAVTSAIVSAVTGDPVYIGVLTGNAVSEDRQVLESILTGNNFTVSEVDLVTGKLNEQDVLILLSPMQDLSEDVLASFDEFLYNGGEYGKTLLYAAGADQPELPDLNVFLREWGIGVGDGAVFETDESHAYGYQPFYPFADYTDETFRDLLKDSSKKVLMPVSRPLNLVYEYRDNKTVTTLLNFSSASGVRPSDAGNNFTADQATLKGPIPAAVMSTWAAGGSENFSNVIVTASAAAFGSSALSNPSIANAEYWTGVLNTITDRGDAVSIEAKSLAGNTLTITTGAARMWSIILCIVIPAVILLTGILVYVKRRYQ